MKQISPGFLLCARHSKRSGDIGMNRKDKVSAALEFNLGEQGKIKQESNLPLEAH